MPIVMVRPMPKPAMALKATFSSMAVAKTTSTRKKVVRASRDIPAQTAKPARAAQVLIRADGAGAKENQGKRAEKFRDKLLREAVHGKSSGGEKEDAPDSNRCILAAKVRGTPVPRGSRGLTVQTSKRRAV